MTRLCDQTYDLGGRTSSVIGKRIVVRLMDASVLTTERFNYISYVENLSNKLFDKLDTHRLPSLDQVLIEIISTCSREDVTFDRLAEIINTDPALTVKVLTIVNSPAYSPVQPLTTLERALITLGIKSIKTLVITASLRQVLNGFNVGTIFNKKQYWRKSLQCGLMVKELASLTGYSKLDEAYLAGLLHNIGELVIASNFPAEFQYSGALNADEQLVFEQKQFGFNRYDVGAWVIDQWDLHPFVSDAILYQQESREHILNSHILVRLIFLANQLISCEKTPDKNSYDLAEQMFGLSASLVRQLVSKVNDAVLQIAQSMLIDLPESDTEQVSQTPGSSFPDEGIAGQPENSSSRLVDLVRERALADSVRPLIESANDSQELLNRLQVYAFVLFGCKRALLFVSDPDQNSLVGLLAGNQDDLITQINVSVSDKHSAIAGAFQQKSPAMSFSHTKKSFTSIVDRQVAKLFSTDGLYCIPVPKTDNIIAVLVFGITETRANRFKKNQKLLEEFALIVGKALNQIGDSQEKAQESLVPEDGLNVQTVRRLVHEANNPLTVLKNYIAILANKLEGTFQEELQIVSDEMDRVGRIIRQISEETYANEEETDINELISDLLKLYRDSYFIPHSVEVSFIPDKKIGRIKVNADAIKQILTNLLKNAIEAMNEPGKIKITTKRDITIEKKQYMEIVVADNGPGMPPVVAEHLFEQPVDTQGVTQGYGLVIVSNLLKQMGGLIRLKTRELKGTSLQILLPIPKSS